MSDTSTTTKKIEVEITFKPATRFSFIDGGKMYLRYLPRRFDSDIPDKEIGELISNANFVEMGYGNNVCFILPKVAYDSSQPSKKTLEEQCKECPRYDEIGYLCSRTGKECVINEDA